MSGQGDVRPTCTCGSARTLTLALERQRKLESELAALQGKYEGIKAEMAKLNSQMPTHLPCIESVTALRVKANHPTLKPGTYTRLNLCSSRGTPLRVQRYKERLNHRAASQEMFEFLLRYHELIQDRKANGVKPRDLYSLPPEDQKYLEALLPEHALEALNEEYADAAATGQDTDGVSGGDAAEASAAGSVMGRDDDASTAGGVGDMSVSEAASAIEKEARQSMKGKWQVLYSISRVARWFGIQGNPKTVQKQFRRWRAKETEGRPHHVTLGNVNDRLAVKAEMDRAREAGEDFCRKHMAALLLARFEQRLETEGPQSLNYHEVRYLTTKPHLSRATWRAIGNL
eukprot:m.361852 g.361852  ORF g.361852 m.361852 type:complete len:344 (+) comp19928_c0_seq1:31-1062(+)